MQRLVNCVVCGVEYAPRSWNSKSCVGLCSDACRAARRAQRAKVEHAPCKVCGVTVELRGRDLQRVAQDRVFCSQACRDGAAARARAASGKWLASFNRTAGAERMRAANPMRDAATRAKVSDTLRERGVRPTVRGGNGTLTEPQRRLAEALGWPTEVAVATGRSGARVLKVDVANPEMRVAVEVDGRSHRAHRVREQDARKTATLEDLGWTVLRFTNEQVRGDLAACVATVRAASQEGGMR